MTVEAECAACAVALKLYFVSGFYLCYPSALIVFLHITEWSVQNQPHSLNISHNGIKISTNHSKE